MHAAAYHIDHSCSCSACDIFVPLMSLPTTSHRHSTRSTCTHTREGPDIEGSCVNHSAPQCCHCGYRGSHSPNCPFGSGRH
ncbi:hypothetical protein V8E52_003529 [Russula decolorans]